jgi:ssDNA-binding Zn-finger/Zn-ribbon topoisomerase 1
MGALDQPSFDRAVRGGCPACGGTAVEIRSFIDRSVVVMAADPNDAGRWVHDGEKFVDGTYRIACAGCARALFESADCPRCHAAGGLARALGEPSRLAVPKRCPKCNELELLAIALVPAAARYGGGEPPKPRPLADFGEPGYHVVAFACDACDHAVVAEGCPLCGAAGPLRERP